MYTAMKLQLQGYVPEGYGKVVAGFLAGMNWIQTALGCSRKVSAGYHVGSGGFRCMTTVCRKFCERLAKVSRKSRESSHVQSQWGGSPFNKYDQCNSQELAKNEANQAHAKTISRKKKKLAACMSSQPIFLAKIYFKHFHTFPFFPCRCLLRFSLQWTKKSAFRS